MPQLRPTSVDPEVLLYIDAYVPKHPDSGWSLIADLVKQCVRHSRPRSTQDARQLLGAMRLLARWSHFEAAVPIDAAHILHGYNIQRFAYSGLEGFTVVSQVVILRRINLIARTTGWGSALIASGPTVDGVRPYADAEVRGFASVALHEPHPRRALALTAMLGLCRGAGLNATELKAVRVEDISEDELGMTVTIRHDRRTVPILTMWDELVRDAIRDRHGRELVFPQARTHIERRNPTEIRPNARRLRATWLVDHLNHRVPMNALLLAAGLTSMDHFIGYTNHMDAVHPNEIRRLMTRRGHDD